MSRGWRRARQKVRDQTVYSPPRQLYTPNPTVNLLTTVLPSNTPLAEMLAIVAEHAVAILAEPRTRSAYDLFAIERSRLLGCDPERISVAELC